MAKLMWVFSHISVGNAPKKYNIACHCLYIYISVVQYSVSWLYIYRACIVHTNSSIAIFTDVPGITVPLWLYVSTVLSAVSCTSHWTVSDLARACHSIFSHDCVIQQATSFMFTSLSLPSIPLPLSLTSMNVVEVFQ
jgi:hypothetical protein